MNLFSQDAPYLILCAVAGAITALFFQPWPKMSWLERAFSVIVGMCFALFGFPLFFQFIPEAAHLSLKDSQTACGGTYFTAVMSHTILPMLMNRWKKKAAEAMGSEEKSS